MGNSTFNFRGPIFKVHHFQILASSIVVILVNATFKWNRLTLWKQTAVFVDICSISPAPWTLVHDTLSCDSFKDKETSYNGWRNWGFTRLFRTSHSWTSWGSLQVQDSTTLEYLGIILSTVKSRTSWVFSLLPSNSESKKGKKPADFIFYFLEGLSLE